MEAERLLEWIDRPWLLDAGAEKELSEILDLFPYFTAARMLHLKALRHGNSFRYNSQLKKTAAHVPSRSVLFEFITSPAPEPMPVKGPIAPQAPGEKGSGRQMSGYPEGSGSIGGPVREEEDPEPVAGRPLVFDRNEVHSFTEWLNLTYVKPIDREGSKTGPAPEASAEDETDTSPGLKPGSAGHDLIDRFLARSPRMSPPQRSAPEEDEVVNPGPEESHSLITETLARVYTEQGLYSKAIRAYHVLSLKYPEKSAYFADRINQIHDLKKGE